MEELTERDMVKNIKSAVEKGHLVVIEREVGAKDHLLDISEVLEGNIYASTAASDEDNIFCKAMPEYADELRIGAPPRVLLVYLSDMNGILLAEDHRDESSMDADIFSGMISAVSNFVKDSIKQLSGEEEDKGGGLDALSYRDDKLGNLTIRIIRGKTGVLIVSYKGDLSREIENDITGVMKWIDQEHGDDIKGWSNNMNEPFLADITNTIRDTFISSGKYDGKFNMDSMMENKEEIKEALLKRINSQKKSVFIFDDAECMDPLSLELLEHLLKNTDVPVIIQYNTGVLEGDLTNETLHDLINYMVEENRCSKLSVRSDIDIEEVISSKLNAVDDDAMKLMSYAAVGDTFKEDVMKDALKKTDIDVMTIIEKLRSVGIVKGTRFANSRLRERALDIIKDDERLEIDIHVATALIRCGDPSHSIRVAEILLPHADKHESVRKKAVVYAVEAGDQLLRNFNTDGALKFFNSAIELDDDPERKQRLLEKTLIMESLTWI